MENKVVGRIDRATNILLVAILLIPFALSFGSLKALANDQHIAYAWMYPLMVDGSLLVFKFLVLRSSLHGQRDMYAWSMAIVATLISVFLNIIHVPYEAQNLLLARFMAGLPPLFILATFAAVAGRIKANSITIDWQGQIKTLQAHAKQLETDAKSAKASADGLQDENGRLQSTNHELQEQINQLQNQMTNLQDKLAHEQEQLEHVQTKWEGIQTPVKAWGKLNKEVQTLALYLAREISAQQAASILNVKDARTVKSRAARLNGESKGVA